MLSPLGIYKNIISSLSKKSILFYNYYKIVISIKRYLVLKVLKNLVISVVDSI